MKALTPTQKEILAFLAEEPAFFTPGMHRRTHCSPARPDNSNTRRVWLPFRVYDNLIKNELTAPNADRRHAPNRDHPLVARFLGATR